MARAYLEHAHATAFLQWVNQERRLFGPDFLIYAIPNGGARDAREGGRLKAEGVVAGMPDYHVPIPRGAFASLYIELKHPGGRLSPSQKRIIDQLRALGNRVVVAYGWEQAADALRSYLNFGREHAA